MSGKKIYIKMVAKQQLKSKIKAFLFLRFVIPQLSRAQNIRK
jgi:hypothetical protein